MWKDNDDRILKLYGKIGKESYPQKCPICEAQDAHMFMYKQCVNEKMGSSWVWCSSCKTYAHTSYQVPTWWKNYKKISKDVLCSSPDYGLDENKREIDLWVNSLVANICENDSAETVTMEEDMNLYEVKILPTEFITEEMLIVVSQMCDCEMNEAERILNKTGKTLPQMIALDAGIVIDELKKDKIQYSVSPKYIW